MNYEQFAEEIRWGVEKMVRDRYGDGVAVVRTVTKNNNVRMKAISIMRKEEKATPTIYIRDYYQLYKRGHRIEKICEEIFRIYESGVEKFKHNFDPEDFATLEKIRSKIFYKLINYKMNEKMLKDVPHFKYLDLAIVFFVMVACDDSGQACAMIHNIHMENWNITKERLRDIAFKNTWEKYPAVIKPMEEIVSEMIIGEILDEEDEDEEYGDEEAGILHEDFVYGSFEYDEIKSMIREEVEKLKDSRDMRMYVLTNNIRCNGATCITYPGVLKQFAKEHDNDIFIIPSSVHEVILIEGSKWERTRLDKMIVEVNRNELDPIEILSDHVYVYDREDEEIRH